MTGTSIGSYRLHRKIGEGGMGAVYEAEHVLLGRRAAVKLLHTMYTARPEIVHRFFNEARATSAIDHPAMISVFDFGYHSDGTAYLVMELLRGESLRARLERERFLAPQLAIQIARQIASGVAAAHAHGIVHRDLKPDNLFLVPDREVAFGLRVKILDFGIAKLVEDVAAGQHRTRTGSLLGTPSYMAPEQCRGAGAIDGRADIYSLGCILFEMVCGRAPFVGDGPGDILVAQITLPPPRPSSFVRGLDPRLEAFILRCLEKSADGRPRSMLEAEAELDRLHDPGRPISHPDQPAWWSGPRTPVPTTLSSATGQPSGTLTRARRRRMSRWLAIVGALGAVGVVAAVIALMPGTRASVAGADAGRVASASPSDAGEARRVAGHTAEPDAEVEAEPGPDAAVAVTPPAHTSQQAPADERIAVTIRSDPPGAQVVIDGRVRGRTAYRAMMEKASLPRRFVLRCDGYEEVEGTLSAARRNHSVKLSRLPDTPLGAGCQ